MKKFKEKNVTNIIILIVCYFVIAFSISTYKTDYVDIRILENISVNTPNRANMKMYRLLKDKNPAFSKMSLQEFVSMTKKNRIKNGIYYIGTPRCLGCQNAVPVLNYVLKEKMMFAYYIDIYDFEDNKNINQTKSKKELKDDLKLILKPFLSEDNILVYALRNSRHAAFHYRCGSSRYCIS